MKMNLKTIGLIAVSGILLTSCKCEPGNQAVNPLASNDSIALDNSDATSNLARIDKDGNYIYDVGKLFELVLGNGSKLNVGESSTENKLYTQLNDANFKVNDDKTQGWVTFDRVNFATGSANLTSESENQIQNIAQILKAFPDATVKIGGYTDNTGSADTNLKVSADRAKTVADKLITAGIDAKRIESEGYGAQHFVCEANDTDECKAQNRRVDLRITKK